MNTKRNYYRNDVDFSQLALQDKDFNKYLKTNKQVNFGDPAAVKQLTVSLLKRDFNLSIQLLDNRLCPPVPNRFNYILWIQDLLDHTSTAFTDEYSPSRDVVGIDIGTGSSAIYPLLGCSQRPRWRFLATDIDAASLENARLNVNLNKLQDRIRVIERAPSSPLIPIDVLDSADIDSVDFVMCNPPFFAGSQELLDGARTKSRPPFSACTGAEIEMCVSGGEVAFVGQMVTESARDIARDRVQWYTSMLGKLSSVSEIVDKVKGLGCKNWCVTEFVQGSKTRRWAVAWSWGGFRPRNTTARGLGSAALGAVGKALLPFPSEVDIPVGIGGRFKTLGDMGEAIDQVMQDLSLKWQWRGRDGVGVGFAKGNVWSRSARRKVTHPGHGQDAMDEDEDTEPALGFKIALGKERNDSRTVDIHVRWIVGQDSVLFESFCGMLKRSLSDNKI